MGFPDRRSPEHVRAVMAGEAGALPASTVLAVVVTEAVGTALASRASAASLVTSVVSTTSIVILVETLKLRKN